MAKVKWNPAIEYVDGSLQKPKKKDGHSHGNYLIGTHRTAPTTNPVCTNVYTRGADSYDRSTPPSQYELAARTRFAAVAGMIKERKLNLSTITTDKANYNAQKDLPGGKKTFQSYLWKICGEQYDASVNG